MVHFRNTLLPLGVISSALGKLFPLPSIGRLLHWDRLD
jgi:hypothetical protein